MNNDDEILDYDPCVDCIAYGDDYYVADDDGKERLCSKCPARRKGDGIEWTKKINPHKSWN